MEVMGGVPFGSRRIAEKLDGYRPSSRAGGGAGGGGAGGPFGALRRLL